MSTLNRTNAEELLKPFAGQLVDVVKDAWKDWLENPIAPNMQHKRVRADIVWNQMITHAKARLDLQEGILVKPMKPWHGVLIADRLFIRMKKADEHLLSRNYPTRSALSYVDQSQDLFEGIARAELVYKLDESETEIERIAVVQRHLKSVVWVVDLLGSEPMNQHVIDFPAAPVPDGVSIANRIIKPKKQAEKDVAQNGK
jgi:hypothetical protein